MHFNNFVEEGFEELFLEGELDGKGVVNFWRGSPGFLQIAIINFDSSASLKKLLISYAPAGWNKKIVTNCPWVETFFRKFFFFFSFFRFCLKRCMIKMLLCICSYSVFMLIHRNLIMMININWSPTLSPHTNKTN